MKLSVVNFCNLAQPALSGANVGNYTFMPVRELNVASGGRGSTATDDEVDAAIAARVLAEIESDPSRVIRGAELADRLQKML